MLALVLTSQAFAQSLPPLPHPNLQLFGNSEVYAVARLPDGSVVFGGSFSSVNGMPRSHIAMLRADGSLDPNWNPSANDNVKALAVDGSGNVYAGGGFTTVGGQSRQGIVKLSGSGTGATDATWNPSAFASAGAVVYALAVDGSGNVYAGGYFTTIGGQSRNSIAKLSGSGTGAADAAWNPSPDYGVSTLAVDGNGNIYVGGSFTTIGGQNRLGIAKLSGSGAGAADATWNPALGAVSALAVDGSGNVYAAGASLAKLSGSGIGAADANWKPVTNGSVQALAVDGSGNVYAGGYFTTIGGQNRNYIAKLSGSGTGATDATWNPSAFASGGAAVYALAVDGSGNVYAGGYFTTINGQLRMSFAMLSSAGAAGAAADAESPGVVEALAMQPDGGVIIGGAFQKADGLPRANILRLQADGTLDPNWNPSAATSAYIDAIVYALAVDGSGNVYAGGDFEMIGGQSHSKIAKLSGSGAGPADPTWNPSPNGGVSALAVDGSGNVYAGGGFTTIGGQNRAGIAKLSGSGSGAADATWNPPALANAAVVVDALAMDGSGNVYAGGSWYTAGGQTGGIIAKLSGSGSGAADSNWNPSPNGGVNSITLDGNGNVYAGGGFTTIGGQNRNYIARLSGSGVADANWNPSASGNQATVYALAVGGSSNVYVGGSFTTIGGQSRLGLAVFGGDEVFRNGFE